MTTFLDDLLDGARRRVADAARQEPLEALRSRALGSPPPPGFRAALARPGVTLISEVKRASPSKGDLAPGIEAVDQAEAYIAGGTHAISVLTEPERFKGSLDDLAAVSALGTPAIRKDFVVDDYQIWEARAAGAAAVLLIVAALDDASLRSLSDTAAAAGLDVLVEAHDEDEVDRANALGATVIGVNARDLRTFDVDRGAFQRLRPRIHAGALAIAESGIRGPEDVHIAREQGADAVLVGEAVVTADDPTAVVAALVDAGRARA